MKEMKVIEVKQSVFADNDADANKLRDQLKSEKNFFNELNVISGKWENHYFSADN